MHLGPRKGPSFYAFGAPQGALALSGPRRRLKSGTFPPAPNLIETRSSPPGEHAMILGSSVVEQPAVNRLVVGSNPTRGAIAPAFPRSRFFTPQARAAGFVLLTRS